jgi:hypothetical protein
MTYFDVQTSLKTHEHVLTFQYIWHNESSLFTVLKRQHFNGSMQKTVHLMLKIIK